MSGDPTAPEPSVMTVAVADVDAAHADAQRRGYVIVHPLTHEPWGVRRFLVRDPHGVVVDVVGHADWSRARPGRSVVATVNWITIEVFDGAVPATGWAQAWHDRLVEAAVTAGAVFWDEHAHSWGVVLEFTFEDERRRDAFRQAPVLLAALDAVPDPLAGVLVYPHRGGGDGIRQPRRPRPVRSGGAAELPLPDPDADRVVACTAEPPATRAVSEPA